MYSYDVEKFKEIFEKNFTYISSFLKNVKRYPEKIALIEAETGKKWTYKALNEEADKIACRLLKDGIKREDCVMYQLMNVPEFAFIYLGCHKIGAVNIPINFRLAPGEIAFILEDSKPIVFFFDITLKDNVKKALELSHYKPKTLIFVGEGECDFAISYKEYVKLEDLEFLDQLKKVNLNAFQETLRLYTSGTTGKPKGVPLNHINEIFTALDVIVNLKLTKDDVLMNLSPWFHRGGIHIGGPTPAFYLGATIVAMRTFSPKQALEAIEKYKVTFVIGVPTMYKVMIEEQKRFPHKLNSLKGVLSMGSPLDRNFCIEMRELFTPNIYNGYGTTETFWNTLLIPDDLPEKAGTAGKEVLFDEVRVVKIYEDKLAEPDELVEYNNKDVGEVIVRTLKSSYSYHQRTEEAQKKFYKGWFYTGDLATWDENSYITIVSRKDDMIIVGGENIYPVQIEEVIEEHPKVMHCAVVGIPDEKRGQALVAYVVKKDESLTLEELKRFVSQHPMLPSYKKPRYWRFVEELPMTSTGKKQHYKLRTQALEDFKKGLLQR